MVKKVDKSISVDAPVEVVYDQLTRFEDYPSFMSGVTEVRQVGDQRLHWVTGTPGVEEAWDAEVLEQVPGRRVAWASTSGAPSVGIVEVSAVGSSTEVHLHLEYEPGSAFESMSVESVSIAEQAQSDLERFKSFVEARGVSTGGWQDPLEESKAGRGDDTYSPTRPEEQYERKSYERTEAGEAGLGQNYVGGSPGPGDPDLDL